MSNFRLYRKIEYGEHFVIFGDTSQGGGDYNACQFFSKTKLDFPIVYHAQGVAAQMTTETQPVFEKLYDITQVKPLIAFERQNGGASEMERLDAMNRLGKYELFVMRYPGQTQPTDSTKLGYDTTSLTRPTLCSDLQEAIDNKTFGIYDEATLRECRNFIKVYRGGKWQGEAEGKGKSGSDGKPQGTDDLVISLGGAIQLHLMTDLKKPEKPYTPPVYQPSDNVIGI